MWTSQELASSAANRVKEVTTLRKKKDRTTLIVDGHEIDIRTDITKEIDNMAKATRRTLGTTQKAIGSRLLNWLRPNH